MNPAQPQNDVSRRLRLPAGVLAGVLVLGNQLIALGLPDQVARLREIAEG